jgi:hypothetical protein
MKTSTYSLLNGSIVVTWPDAIDHEEFEDIRRWIELVARQITRPKKENRVPEERLDMASAS